MCFSDEMNVKHCKFFVQFKFKACWTGKKVLRPTFSDFLLEKSRSNYISTFDIRTEYEIFINLIRKVEITA